MQLSTIFSDGMVLQRNKPIEIKGYSQGNQVTVVFAGKVYKIDMLTNSYFELTLPCMEAGGPYEMVLYDGEKTIISDILIGDVFVLGGQSNMELPIERWMFRQKM
jgi:sialate O-acetylesterase